MVWAASVLEAADDFWGGVGGGGGGGETRMIGLEGGAGLGASRTVFISEPDDLGMWRTFQGWKISDVSAGGLALTRRSAVQWHASRWRPQPGLRSTDWPGADLQLPGS